MNTNKPPGSIEGYGLFRRRRWGEYLTIISTALLLVPEIQELHKHPTWLKVGGLVLNVVIVVYLIGRQLQRGKRAPTMVGGVRGQAA